MASRSRSPTTPRSRAASRSRSGTRMRAGQLVGGLVVAALLIAVPDTGLFVMWKVIIPTLPLLFLDRPRPVAQPLPARRLQPDAARAQAHEGADGAELAEGIRLRHRLQPVHPVRRPAPLRPRRQRRLLARCCCSARWPPPSPAACSSRARAAGARRSARCCRSSASTARRRSRWSPTRTASRASAASRTATTSTRAPPTWPTSTTPTPTGAATGATSSARSRASCSRFFEVPNG